MKEHYDDMYYFNQYLKKLDAPYVTQQQESQEIQLLRDRYGFFMLYMNMSGGK